MAFFKFRKGGDEPSATPVQPESVEAMRKRAQYRLIGATVLILIGVIGLPLLFDKQPRPISIDMPIDIPDKNKAKPLSIPLPVAAPSVKPDLPAPILLAATSAPIAAAPKQEEKVVEVPVDKPVEKPVPLTKTDDGAKARALLEGKASEKKAVISEGRFVVQVGAFSDPARARDVRLKVEHAGLKTYTHVAQTKDGERTRVRVGPFETRAEADNAAQKIKKLDLPAAILTL